jgi:hypothetical protein
MKNPTGKKLDKLIFGMFDQMIEGVDQYNHSGSLWLIFTDEKQWVVEYTVGGTLWYNYKLFKNEMEFIGMDCVDNKEYITRWFEDRFLNKPKVGDTWENSADAWYQVENTIQEGVKRTNTGNQSVLILVEDAIQNGVKETEKLQELHIGYVEDAIQIGVKVTTTGKLLVQYQIEDTIQNGVKNTRHWTRNHLDSLEDTIQNGVKNTDYSKLPKGYSVDKTIENGVKHTMSNPTKRSYPVEDTIQNGVKKTDFNMYRDNNAVEDTIQNGVKDTLGVLKVLMDVDDVIQDGVKETKRSYDGSRKQRTKNVIENGVKESREVFIDMVSHVEYTIENGEKLN